MPESTPTREQLLQRIERLEDQLRTRQAEDTRLKKMLQDLAIGWWEVDLDSGTVAVDDKQRDMLGYDPAEFDLHNPSQWLELIHPDDRDGVIEAMRAHIDGTRTTFREEYRIRSRQGEYRWSLNSAEVTEWHEDGSPGKLTGLALDITELKKAQQQALENEAMFRTMFESSPIGIQLLSDKGELLYVNKACLALFHTDTNAPAQGSSVFQDAHVPERVKKELAEGKTVRFEVEFDFDEARAAGVVQTDRSGKMVLDVMVAPLTEVYTYHDGSRIGYVTMLQDITRQRTAQRRLRHSQRMEAIGHLAGGIAHDFNNILSGIVGFADLTHRRADIDDKTSRYMKNILDAAERAKQSIAQIHSFSRHPQDTHKEAVWLKPVITEVTQLLEASVPATVGIEVSCAEQTRPVYANAHQVHEALTNVCTNAVYAMEEKGALRITLSERTIEDEESLPQGRTGLLRPGTYACIAVHDTGCGMDDELVERIFDPYFTTKPMGKGTGMGLSMVYNIMKAHDGEVVIESTPGKGTAISLLFPHARDDVTLPAEKPRQGTIAGGTERVMVVDDETSVIEVFRDILEQCGYRVDTFSCGEDALAAITKKPDLYDLVITDQIMPYMTGIELTRHIHRIAPRMPVVLCTGYIKDMDMQSLEKQGVSAMCRKPLDMHSLAQVVRRALDTTATDQQG